MATNADIKSVTVSSVLENNEKQYGAKNLFNRDITAWCVGKEDGGIGEKITIEFNKTVKVQEITIVNGLNFIEYWQLNNRVKEISLNGEKITLKDYMNPYVYKLKIPVITDKLILEIKSVYSGSKFKDTCISEISFGPITWDYSESNPFGPFFEKTYTILDEGIIEEFGDQIRTKENGKIYIYKGGCQNACKGETFSCKKISNMEFSCGNKLKLTIKDNMLFINGKPTRY